MTKAGGGVNALGITNDTTGKFEYFSRAQDAIRDKATDPRVLNDDSSTNPLYGGQSSEVKTASGADVPLERTARSSLSYCERSTAVPAARSTCSTSATASARSTAIRSRTGRR